jgi:predicted DNA-binding protein (UPF0251 family)
MTSLEMVFLSREELESYRLRYIEGLQQTEAARQMRTSQSTYQRILSSAHRKIADALIHGKAIRLLHL